jgi:Tol biopolymer transport system component
MVNADGTNPHLVLRGSDIYANWSMNGQWIVFDQGAQIYKAPVIGDSIDNTHIVRLTSMGRNFLPAFSPDGKWIAFDSNLNDSLGANVIWKIKADGSEIHDISKHGIGEWRMPNWSPDGGKIVHQRYIDVDAPEIVVMDTWGDNSTRLTNDKRFESFPRYSRDGLKIAFQSQLEGLPHVWVMNADGSNQCQLTTDGGETPAWSPDGRLVYVHYNPLKRHPGNGTLWIMNSDGSNKHQITFGPY